MSDFSFRVYIDESGDEGFVFNPDNTGSSRWLVLSAVITRRAKDPGVVALMRGIREQFKRTPKQPLHFLKLNHAQCVAYTRAIGQSHDLLRTISILIHKPSLDEPEKFQAQKHLLYRYAARLLLERVSWFCRDHHIKDVGDGSADIIFSNRDQMSYDELREYLRVLKEDTDRFSVSIHWPAINPDKVRAVQHEQLAGLQIADAVAHSLYDAVSPNRYGDVESRYAKQLWPTFYRHKGAFLGYGLKFWPDDFEKIKSANPQLAVFAEGDVN